MPAELEEIRRPVSLTAGTLKKSATASDRMFHNRLVAQIADVHERIAAREMYAGAAWGIKELLRQMLQAHGPNGVQSAPDLDSPDPVPAALFGRGHARGDPAGGHDREVVARDRRLLRTRQHQRPDRGLEPRHQSDQTRRLRVP